MIFGARAFFGYAQAPDGEVWWFVNVPARSERSLRRLAQLGEDGRRAHLLELFADDAGPACALINEAAETMPLTPIHTVPRLSRWHRDRMIVIGDAAHAPSPTSGQGASLGIEDAAILAICLRDTDDAGAAFGRFERARRARVERIVKWASRINNNKAPGPVGRLIRDVTLPTILKLTADSKAHRQTFEHHIEWNDRLVAARARR